MNRKSVAVIICCMLISLCLSCQAAVTLPMDTFDGGSVPLASGYVYNETVGGYESASYEDDTIKVKIWREMIPLEEFGMTFNTDYTFAEVWIQDASQLRTALGGDVKTPHTTAIENLCKRTNAVLAINGDWYQQRGNSLIVRQSAVVKEANGSPIDMLIIDYNGDFHIFNAEEKAQAVIDMEGQIYQVISFGPGLIVDGVKCEGINDCPFYDVAGRQPRAAIGQMGPLHYLLMVAEARNDRSSGVTGERVADVLLEKGCVQAYNLDGGNSAVIAFDGEIFNHQSKKGARTLFDIIYFASATEQAE